MRISSATTITQLRATLNCGPLNLFAWSPGGIEANAAS